MNGIAHNNGSDTSSVDSHSISNEYHDNDSIRGNVTYVNLSLSWLQYINHLMNTIVISVMAMTPMAMCIIIVLVLIRHSSRKLV